MRKNSKDNIPPDYKIPISSTYPIFFLAGSGVFFYFCWVLNLITTLNGSPIDFNYVFKGSGIIWFMFGGAFFSLFVGLIHADILRKYL